MPRPTEKQDLKPTTIRLPRDWHEELRDRAFRERRHMSDLILDAVGEKYGLKRQPVTSTP